MKKCVRRILSLVLVIAFVCALATVSFAATYAVNDPTRYAFEHEVGSSYVEISASITRTQLSSMIFVDGGVNQGYRRYTHADYLSYIEDTGNGLAVVEWDYEEYGYLSDLTYSRHYASIERTFSNSDVETPDFVSLRMAIFSFEAEVATDGTVRMFTPDPVGVSYPIYD